MDTVKCPLKQMQDEQIELGIIFDTRSIKQKVFNDVCCVFNYIIKNQQKKSTECILNIMKANLGEKRYNIIKEQYIDSFFKNKKMTRYILAFDDNMIFNIMDSFDIIFGLIPSLEKAAIEIK